MPAKYPEVYVQFHRDTPDGNIFFIMARVSKGLKEAGATPDEIAEFSNSIFDCDRYEAALKICMEWVTCK